MRGKNRKRREGGGCLRRLICLHGRRERKSGRCAKTPRIMMIGEGTPPPVFCEELLIRHGLCRATYALPPYTRLLSPAPARLCKLLCGVTRRLKTIFDCFEKAPPQKKAIVPSPRLFVEMRPRSASLRDFVASAPKFRLRSVSLHSAQGDPQRAYCFVQRTESPLDREREIWYNVGRRQPTVSNTSAQTANSVAITSIPIAGIILS